MIENITSDHITLGSAIAAATAWVWKKMSNTDSKVTALELKIAENYVTKNELKIIEDKIDHNSELTSAKLDKINDTLLLLIKNG